MMAYFCLLLLLLSISLSSCQSSNKLQDIRLAGTSGTYYAGRLEVKYNGTWGTICDNSWGISDSQVACRMLGFTGQSCHMANAHYGRASSLTEIWMDRVNCNGNETSLEDCGFNGWGERFHTCRSHRDDVSVVCTNESFFEVPIVRVVNTTITTITLSWKKVDSEIRTRRQRYRVQINSSSSYRTIFAYTRSSAPTTIYYTLTALQRGETYSISVRFEGANSQCRSFYYFNAYSAYSDSVEATTNTTAPPSKFQVRLIPNIQDLNYSGRLEVNYDNKGWGTVCDNSFNLIDANAVCNMLNFKGAICVVSNAQLGRGSGKIWLNNVGCPWADVLDQCTYDFYNSSETNSNTNCRSNHRDDVGVFCRPDPDDFLPPPQNFSVSDSGTSGTSITFRWNRYPFPSYLRGGFFWYYGGRRFRLVYTRSDVRGSTYYRYVSYYYSNSYTLSRIPLGVTVNASIAAEGRFTQYGCYSYISGSFSETVSVTTVERPPSGAPLNFHIAVLNCTAIHTEWDLPAFNSRNGIVRGFLLIYKENNGQETTLDLNHTDTEYIVGNLKPSTSYTFSVLAYTNGNGPRSIHLVATTNDNNICQTDIIDVFGINGGNLDRYTASTYRHRSINVFCGSRVSNIQIDWYFPNGTKVGIANRRVREGHYPNGTTVLQIGLRSYITVCDGGVYTCLANVTSLNKVQQKTFKLLYGSSPPTPTAPRVLKVDADKITIAWPSYNCDGGHNLQFFNVRVGYRTSFSSSLRYRYLNGIDARQKNYTITGLNSGTTYYVSVQAVGRDYTTSSLSRSVSAVTLPPVPMPPDSVTATLVSPETIMVTWTRPTVSSGSIVYYTVYAMPFVSEAAATSRSKRQSEQPLQAVAKNFSSTETSGNVTLRRLGMEYHVQVSATVFDSASRFNRESLFSSLTPTSILFVPTQGLPFPTNVRVSETSNASLTVSWETPQSTGHTIMQYLVEYSATVDGRSLEGNYISYLHEGNATISSDVTSLTIQPLVPRSNYLIKVAAITTRGEGMQVTTTGSTTSADSESERFVYFQVRFGPVPSCASFRKDLDQQEYLIHKQIFGYLKYACSCSFTDANIENGFFLCGAEDHQILYRAHIIGTRDYSANDLVELLQDWVASAKAYVTVSNFRMLLDSTCSARLDMMDSAECPVNAIVTTTPTTSATEKTEEPEKNPDEGKNNGAGNSQGQRGNNGNIQTANQSNGISLAALGGLLVGFFIILLLVIVIVLVIVAAFWKFNNSSSRQNRKNGRSLANTKRESVMGFAELENSGEGFEEKFPDSFN